MALTTRMRRRCEAQPAGIAAEIAGDVSGQLAVGSHIVQVSAQHGAIVNVAASGQQPRIRPRSRPAAILPRPAPGLVGREQELQRARAAVRDAQTLELHGPGGIGKTAILRALCHDDAPKPEHGVVFMRAAGQPSEDVGQQLFDALYESDVPFKPTPVELCQHLQDRRALVVLDDVGWERDDLAGLLDWAPACTFALACEQPLLLDAGSSQPIGGLAPEAALALLERALDRPLDPDERPHAVELCRRLDGRPLGILQAAALARESALPVAGSGQLEQLVRDRLEPSEQRALATLEALRPAAVHADDVAAIAGVPAAATVLERLGALGVAQANSPRWNVILKVEVQLGPGEPEPDPDPDAELASRALEQLTRGDEPSRDDVPALLAALASCARSGRWLAVAEAVRKVDKLLTLAGRWGAWLIVLEHARAAAAATGDRAGEAWALHQLGTRAGCRGELDAARPLLAEALELRRSDGDADGAAVTAHNLAVFDGTGGTGWWPPHPALLAVVIALLLAGGTAAALVSHRDDAGTAAAPTAVPVQQSVNGTTTSGNGTPQPVPGSDTHSQPPTPEPTVTTIPPTVTGRGTSDGTPDGTTDGTSQPTPPPVDATPTPAPASPATPPPPPPDVVVR
jgi:NB-ARC domain